MSQFKLSATSKKNMEGIDQRLIDLAIHAITLTKIDFGIPSTGGVRSSSQQHELFLQNRSDADGYTKRSKHQDGRALDFFAYVDGKVTYDAKYMSQIAAAFLQTAIELKISVRWGGLFYSSTDMPHIELEEQS